MTSGFFALLDDIAVIAKTTAAALDDVAIQAVKASKKAAGIVIDDAAVTPRYVVGFAAERELPIIAKIAWGSIKNKTLILLPAAVGLSFLAPWAITPLLMAGGAYLCFEGYEKVVSKLRPPQAPDAVVQGPADARSAKEIEDAKVASAVRTDFILSAEVMAISLSAVTTPSILNKTLVLGSVGLLVTVAVYGTVALIVKADDVGLHLAQKGGSRLVRGMGQGIVNRMPGFLALLSFIGMLAMLWVGGGILVHSLEEYGWGVVPKTIHAWAAAFGAVFGPLTGFMTWLVDAGAAALVGLAAGALVAGGVRVWMGLFGQGKAGRQAAG